MTNFTTSVKVPDSLAYMPGNYKCMLYDNVIWQITIWTWLNGQLV